MRGASRFRWKNPVGVYPLEADTVMLLGANGESVILVGSQGRFAVDGYPLHDGRPCWRRFRTSSHPNSFCL